MKTIIRAISVNGSPRRKIFSKYALGAGVEWTFFDAVQGLGESLRYDQRATLIHIGRTLNNNELGCFSSHVALWRELLADPDAQQMLVLEDDTVVDWPYVRQLLTTNFSEFRIDYVRLYAKMPSPYRIVQKPVAENRRFLIEFLDFALGTQAYIISRRGAEKLLDRCAIVERGIDAEMDRAWSHGVRNLAIFPFPVIELSGESSIGGPRYRGLDGSSYEIPSRLVPHFVLFRTFQKLQRTSYRFFHPKLSIARIPTV